MNFEMVLFDRSWYNRAGVERVMRFTSDEQYRAFIRSCPMFERLLIDSGIILIKYWFSVSAQEQERRFKSRIQDPTKRWKISRWTWNLARAESFPVRSAKAAPSNASPSR